MSSATLTDPALADVPLMRRALQLAALGLNTTDPNPRVGCVLVRGSEIVGEGWHERAGAAHAEVRALQAAGAAAADATAYVSLEPCSHFGRTPPCVDALIAARVARVVYAVEDPNPKVAGRGAAALRAAGIKVQGGVLAEEARALNPGFFKRMQTGLPWVRLKLGASLDGRTALAKGASQWITGAAARADVQRYRARSSAILTGVGTVLADDPQLNVRLPETSRQPLRVLLDSQLRAPLSARVFEDVASALVFGADAQSTAALALQQRGVRVESIPAASGGGLDLQCVLQRLAQLQINELWVECGARLAGAFLHAALVDELIVYVAPSLLGPQARALVELPLISDLAQRLQLEFTDCTRVGEDLRLTARPLHPRPG